MSNNEKIEKDIDNNSYINLYSNKEIFIDLLKNMLDSPWSKDLRPEHIELIDKSFITSDYKEQEADIIYSANINNNEIIFYMLLESQSAVDYNLPLRLFFYMSEILKEYSTNSHYEENKKITKIPAIIPIVLYNGTHKWETPTSFADIVYNGQLFKNYMINFSYNILDINNNYSKEELIHKKCITSAIFMLDQKIEPIEFLNRIKDIVLFFDNLTDKELQILKQWIKDSIEDKLADTAINLLGSNKKEIVKMVDTNAHILSEMKEKTKEEGIREGKLEGLKEGKFEGRLEGKIEGREKEKEKYRIHEAERVQKLLSKKFGELTDEYKKKIQELDSEKIDCILDNILDIESLDDIEF